MITLPTHNLSASRKNRLCFHILTLTGALVLLSSLWVTGACAGSLIYKNYIVRYDRGWDILCEPYVVKKDDWVLKIFRQKGEIAHRDFREFLGIFKRLNPHVQDIDLIQPGQTIDIPLKKLEHGTLPGQASGTVTIPFVTLAKVIDVLHRNTQIYRVRHGDTISQLIARRFGRYGTRSYKEGVKLLQAANPDIKNLNRIYAGQRIYLPDPSIRQKKWYNALYDEKGGLRKTIDLKQTAAGAGLPLPARNPTRKSKQSGSALAAAAAAVDGKLLDKGTYYVPRPGQEDFEIDLSRYPLLQMKSGSLLFSRNGHIMNQAAADVQSFWPGVKIAPYDDKASAAQMVGAIFQALDGKAQPGAQAGFEDHGTLVAVRSKWIKSVSDHRRLCITPINGLNEQTPDSMRRYLDRHGIVLREILPSGRTIPISSGQNTGRHAVKDILAIMGNGPKEFVQHLARALGFTYAPQVPVTFPYAGMQIQAYADLISTRDGHEVLVDFGDLYGDSLKALRQSGQNVIQIAAQDSHAAIVHKLFLGLGVPFAENPTFLAAARPAEYNTSITIPGILYTGPQNKRVLLSGAPLEDAVTDVLSARGIAVVTW